MRSLVIIISLALAMSVSYAKPKNPPTGHTGSPKDRESCIECHNSYAVNSGDGYFLIFGLPEDGYVPGKTYEVSVTLSDPEQSRWGFELSAIHVEGKTVMQGGSFVLTDPDNTCIACDMDTQLEYVTHTEAGTFAGSEKPAVWCFNWTAPETNIGEIGFYAAGIASDYGNSPLGDYCYVTSVAVQPSH